MSRRLLSYDPESRVAQWYVSDPAEGKFWFETVQDCSPVVEDNKSRFNSIDERARWGEWTKVASIPMTVYQNLMKSGVARDDQAMKRWLNT